MVTSADILSDVIPILSAGVICGVICMAIAKSKGITGGFWWGFFLGIIGVIILAVRPKERSRQNTNGSITNAVLYCRNCDKVFGGKEAFACPNCNSLLLKTNVPLNEWYSFEADKKSKLKKEFAENKHISIELNTTNPDFENCDPDELRKFKELLDDGVITQEEFDAKKKQLLGL